MAKRKSPTAGESTTQPAPEVEAGRDAATEATAAAPAEPQAFTPTQAPPPVEGRRPWTTDNVLGYRVEDIDTPDGPKRQIRFADREGGQRPDDEPWSPSASASPS